MILGSFNRKTSSEDAIYQQYSLSPIKVKLLFLFVSSFVLLRFFYLDADFPLGVTWSGTLFTDEGWYANAAVRHYISGNWYVAGDFNPAINMPIGQFLFRLSFSIFGLGFSSGRLVIATCFVLMLVLVTKLVYQRFGFGAAILTALLLATNYSGFAYSRLMVMETPAMMFVVAGLSVAGIHNDKGSMVKLFIASILISIGILAKTTMIFMVPLLAYIAWRQARSQKKYFPFLMASGAGIFIVLGGYYLTAKTMFPADFSYFQQLNFAAREHENILAWLKNIPHLIFQQQMLGPGLVALAAVSTICALFLSESFRKDLLVHILIGFIVIYLGILSLVVYSPPRYFLPLIIPITALCAISITELMKETYNKSWLKKLHQLSLIILAGIILIQGGRIINYMTDLNFTFVDMAHEAVELIEKQEGSISNVAVLGHITDSVAIETGIHSINSRFATSPLKWRLEKYKPKYFLMHSDKGELPVIDSLGATYDTLKKWDVFANYWWGHQVELLQISWPNQ